MSKPRVVIYRDFLLPASETFIKSQADGLRRFEPIYLGLRRVDGIEIAVERSIVIQQPGLFGILDRALFSRTGLSVAATLKLLPLRPRMLHAHFGVDASRIMRFAHSMRLPMLVTLHDYDITTSDAELLKLAPYCATYIARRPELNRRATKFIAVSNFIKQKAILRGFSAEKIAVHHIGIDVDRFQPDPPHEREKIVLFVGRLVEKKGCKYLIQAMATVQRSHPDAELVIVGDGPERQELEALAASALKRYRFLGVQSPAQVKAWHNQARVFCLPSVTAASGETEGLPISILEAQAMNLVVVATRHAGVPESVEHGETGLLADERDALGLAAQLEAALGSAELSFRLAAAARQQVHASFNLSRQNALLEQIYDRVIAAPAPSQTVP
jgi:colanic acid/amylovoran biosynthesis glycosyltransferase